MPRLVGDDPIVIDDDSDDEIFLYSRRPASPQSVASSSSEDVLILDDSPDDSPDTFPDDISEQTLNVDDTDFLSVELAPAVAHATFDDEPPAFDVSSSDTEFLAAKGSPIVDLPESTLINPRSVAANYVPSMPISSERHAVNVLARMAERVSLQPNNGNGAQDNNDKAVGPEFVYIDLDDFEIYIHAARSKNRLRSLHFLGAGKNSNNRMYFDGILSVDSTKFYVQRVPFDEAPVDRYGTDFDTVQGNISIRSVLNGGREIYYRLGQPSTVYARFYYPHLWVADLGKHFVDFVDKVTDRDHDVRISHFRLHFAKWLYKTHGRSPVVAAWRKQYGVGRDDFGPAVIAYGDYLWKEASAVLGPKVVCDLGFFRESATFTFYKTHLPRVPADHQPSKPLPTVVTPYMYHMFKDLAIGPYLESTPGKHAPKRIDGDLILPQKQRSFITGPLSSLSIDNEWRNIRPGDLISTLPDGATTSSKWSASAEKSEFWYALVHRVIEPRRSCGQRSFDVVWLYRPEHTPCGDMKFPWAKELFMCDHCTCSENDGDDNKDGGERANAILEDEVVAVHSVEWFGGPDTTADFFIRQTYLHGERSWVQLRLGHIFCQDSVSQAVHQSAFSSHFGTMHNRVESIGIFEKVPNYVVGDTVLAVLSKKNKRSEPYEIQDILDPESLNGHSKPTLLTGYRLRRLLRRNETDPDAANAPPNELLYTDETVIVTKVSRIIGRCVVRIFPDEIKKIPTPYNRGGAGNVFYMTHRLEKTAKARIIVSDIPGASLRNDWGEYETRVVPLDPAKDAPHLRQGFDPATPVPRLRALELFCGCGNLGRGIEDAGATETRCANDIWPVAMHTFMANVASPDTVQPFIGSADTLLERAIGRSASALLEARIPAPGDIDFISGGSPCQGFSTLTKDKEAQKQYKNRSMVASFASFVDLYRPKFGILENVAAIVSNGKKGREKMREDIFGQLLCSLLGLGYQLRIMLGNAWSYGAPQQRQRVFLIFAAPGFQLPNIPLPSHGSELGEGLVRSQRTIGRLATGEHITDAGHANVTTAFPIVSAGQATADLADDPAAKIDDGIVEICVRHPDHRIAAAYSDAMQHKMAAIPMQPYGMGLAQARHTRHFALLGGRELFKKREQTVAVTKAYKRTNPTQLFKTVRTMCSVADARSAGDLHWREPRALSILEIRRAQGIPDEDLLLQHNKADQWKLVGNAVARQIALALGLSLREAWLGTLCEDRRPTQPVPAPEPVLEPASVRRQSSYGSGDELGSVPIAAGSPALTTTTTTAATLMTTLTLTTTTTTTRTEKSTLGKTASVGIQSDDLPFKQNRIFQTSVRSNPSSSPAAPPSKQKRTPLAQDDGQDELSDGFVMLKRSQSRWPSDDSDDDDGAMSKRQRSASSSNSSGRKSQGGDRREFVDDTDVIVID